jgi:predicted transposase/invertase (TIGR01784 family)
MPDDSLHQPHDKLFRATFSDPRNAAGFLRQHLGDTLASHVDWNSLSLLSSSFIDSHMKGSEADLLFSVKIGDADALLYILWEHQRSEAPLMALRLLSYMVRIWREYTQKQGAGSKLAPILPVVLAQDKDRWKTSTHFHELFDFPTEIHAAAKACTPDFAFRLLQLVDLAYADIGGTPEGILTLRSLKAAPLGELLDNSVWDREIITGVSHEAVERFFRYILNANVDRRGFDANVTRLHSERLTTFAMTLAEQFREEGLQNGLKKGRQEGRQEGEIHSRRQALLDVLEARFGELPAGLVEALATVSDTARLEKLLKCAAVCADLEAFASNY